MKTTPALRQFCKETHPCIVPGGTLKGVLAGKNPYEVLRKCMQSLQDKGMIREQALITAFWSGNDVFHHSQMLKERTPELLRDADEISEYLKQFQSVAVGPASGETWNPEGFSAAIEPLVEI